MMDEIDAEKADLICFITFGEWSWRLDSTKLRWAQQSPILGSLHSQLCPCVSLMTGNMLLFGSSWTKSWISSAPRGEYKSWVWCCWWCLFFRNFSSVKKWFWNIGWWREKQEKWGSQSRRRGYFLPRCPRNNGHQGLKTGYCVVTCGKRVSLAGICPSTYTATV